MLTALRAPGQVDSRWLTEDVPYGLATWAVLGDQAGVKTPVMEPLITLASAALARDFRATRRAPRELGIDGMTGETLETFLRDGVVPV